MMKFAILFALVAAAAASPVVQLNPLSPVGRIVGGVDTSISKVPYQGSVRIFGFLVCGCSIVGANWVITAAHCMGSSLFAYTIRTGTDRANSGGSVSQVASVIVHPGYKTNRYGVPEEDIAMMKLQRPLSFSSIRSPIPLFSYKEPAAVGALGVITGWGATQVGGSTSNILQTVTVPIVSTASCNEAYIFWGGLPDRQICAAMPEGGRDACQGDSGGPLAIGGRLAGIVSWGNGCAHPNFPGVYTEVAPYREWITQTSGM